MTDQSTTMRFRIKQHGITSVAIKSDTLDIMHYAIMYREEGDVVVQYHNGTQWKQFAFLCQWPLE